MNSELHRYVEAEILPRYDHFDAAPRRDHAEKVIRESLELARDYQVDLDMVYAIAAYHDTGLVIDRKTHHLESGRIVREDQMLSRWFSPLQIETMAEAVEDHRASADHEPRSIYGRLVAEADRNIDIDVIIRRTVQYGLSHYPEIDRQGHISRTLQHLDEKYSSHGYLKLWIPGSRNEQELHRLWQLMDNEGALLAKVSGMVDEERFGSWLATYAAQIEAIRTAAHQLHDHVNQHYDVDKPYGFHLDMVADGVRRYGHLVCHEEQDLLPLFLGAYFHDSIEDARLTYNDVRKQARRLGLTTEQSIAAAEIVFALTNEKGRTRAERAGERYYQGIRSTPYAPFCKVCDRLANLTYSALESNEVNHRMLRVYRFEMPHFLSALQVDTEDSRYLIPQQMLDAISLILSKV